MHQGIPIPFSHPAIVEGLGQLFFHTTGQVGVRFQSWFGDRYPNPGIAFVVTIVSARLVSHTTDLTSSID
jgi:hypothetical protein